MFQQKGVLYEYLDVHESPEYLETMLKLTDGVRRVPVIIDGDNITIGFNGRT
ncbi:MAG: hypothetical protein GY714_30785 [Desulfobacterales bacterium]|nr:hypothetical protein [Desulfobacterales bacterium]MCP4158558.1 hypothetical protein [Deltaproteobacteria bacterium]